MTNAVEDGIGGRRHDVVDDLNSREAIEYIHTVLREGTSADRQLAVFRETGDLKAVVQFVVQETKAGVERPEARRGA